MVKIKYALERIKMNIKSSIGKKILVIEMTLCVFFSNLYGINIYMEKEVTAEAATSGVLSNDDRGVLFANSRSDFRDESIYFVITTRFYDGDSSNNTRTSEDKKEIGRASSRERV